MKTSKNILTRTPSSIDISIKWGSVIYNFQYLIKKSIFIISFLFAFIGISQTSNIYISTDTQIIGLEKLYINETETTSKETLYVKNNNSSQTFFVHSSTLLYLQTEQNIKIVFIDSQNKTKTLHRHKENKYPVATTTKKTSKTTKTLVASHNPSSGASGVSADFTPMIPIPTYKNNNTVKAVAIFRLTHSIDLQKQKQITNYHNNIRAYSLPIEYSNRPPPC